MLKPSTSLDWYLGYIHCMLEPGREMPIWNGIKITESMIPAIDGEVESLGKLIEYTDYYERFEYLVTQGRSWINLNVLGMINEDLILSVEVPNREPEGAKYTSVNMSGMHKSVITNNYQIQFTNDG